MTAAARAVFVLMDGVPPDVFRRLLERGDLPNIARHVVEPGGLTVGTTVFPSTTGVAYVPFLFGRYPGPMGVPGIRWLDRAGASGSWHSRWRAARSYCGIQVGWLNDDLAPSPSLFTLVAESLAICTPITRGLRPGAHLIPLKRAVLGTAAHYAGTYQALDDAVAEAWLAAADGAWRFLFVVFPGIDGLSHLNHPEHPKVLAAYHAMDRALGAFAARAARSGPPPLYLLSSDHGFTVIREHVDVAEWLEARGVPTLRHPVHVWRRGAQAAVMVSGNCCVNLYWQPRSGRAAPRTESELPADLLRDVATLRGVRLATWRRDGGGIVIARGAERAHLAEVDGKVVYTPINGDPLGLGAGSLSLADRPMLEASRSTPFPDGPRQLLQLFATPRAGDVALASEPGIDFRGPWEIPEHRAGHGSLGREHLEVPIAASVPVPAAPLRTVDLMPTILEHLGVAVPPGLDGVPFSRLGAAAGVRA